MVTETGVIQTLFVCLDRNTQIKTCKFVMNLLDEHGINSVNIEICVISTMKPPYSGRPL